MMRRRKLGQIVSILLLCCCPAVMAQELEAWQSDSLSAHPIIAKPDEQQVYEVLLKMLDRCLTDPRWMAGVIVPFFLRRIADGFDRVHECLALAGSHCNGFFLQGSE